MDNGRRFYTYAYLRADGTPYYIGKGTKRRIYSRLGRPCSTPKDRSRIIFLKQNLTEEEAFKHEIYMIAVYGRKDLGTGILHNRTSGGEGTSGCSPSLETRAKMSAAHKGRTFSEEHRAKIGAASKGKPSVNRGKPRKPLSTEHRLKISEAMKGHTVGEGHRTKLSDRMSSSMWITNGVNNRRACTVEGIPDGWRRGRTSRNGKTLTDEHKRKISEAKIGIPRTEETKRKMGEARKSLKWWNDGCGNTKATAESPGEGWSLGRK
jgi:hypothetical protein